MKEKTNISGLKKHFSVIFVAVILLACVYLYVPLIQSYSLTPKWLVLAIISLILVLFTAKKLSWKPNVVISVWFAFVIICLFGCFRSYNFWDSLMHMSPLIIAPLLIVMVNAKINDLKDFYSKLSVIVAFIILPLLLYSIYDLTALIINGDYSHDRTYLFRFSFGHRNQYSQFLVLLVPLLFAGFSGKTNKKIVLFTTIFLIYAVAILLKNRTVLIVLFGVYPILFFFFLIRSKSQRLKRLLVIAMVLIAGASLVVLSSVKFDPTSKIGNLVETNFGSGNERLRIWSNSIELAKEKPVLGYGTGDWKAEILRTPLRFTQAEQNEVFYQRAHNDFVQVLIEQGLLGLIVFVAFFILIVFRFIKFEMEVKHKIAGISGVLAFITFAFFSFPLEKVELLILLFIFLLPIIEINKELEIRDEKSIFTAPQFYILTTILISLISAIGYLLQNEIKYFDYKKSSDVSILEDIDKSFYSIDPNSTPIQWHIANKQYQSQEYQEAINSYQIALESSPFHTHALNNIGSSFYALGQLDSAKKYYDKALDVNPLFTETLMNYASLKFNEKDIDGALNIILEVVVEWEPENYRMYIAAIAKAKCLWLIDLHDQPDFEVFLAEKAEDPEFLYQISLNCRKSGAAYEDELRIYFSENY